MSNWSKWNPNWSNSIVTGPQIKNSLYAKIVFMQDTHYQNNKRNSIWICSSKLLIGPITILINSISKSGQLMNKCNDKKGAYLVDQIFNEYMGSLMLWLIFKMSVQCIVGIVVLNCFISGYSGIKQSSFGWMVIILAWPRGRLQKVFRWKTRCGYCVELQSNELLLHCTGLQSTELQLT